MRISEWDVGRVGRYACWRKYELTPEGLRTPCVALVYTTDAVTWHANIAYNRQEEWNVELEFSSPEEAKLAVELLL